MICLRTPCISWHFLWLSKAIDCSGQEGQVFYYEHMVASHHQCAASVNTVFTGCSVNRSNCDEYHAVMNFW